MLRQLSVFIENNQGSLADLTQALESREIIIHSLALADASRFGGSGPEGHPGRRLFRLPDRSRGRQSAG